VFHLDDLNERIRSFDYGYVDIRNKPSEISYRRLAQSESQCLGQTASKLWCLARDLPLLIGDWIPAEEVHYSNFLLLLDIIDLTFAPVTSAENVALLKENIKDHTTFRQLYLNESFTPKLHYNIHIPEWIVKVEPLCRLWCMRFEAKNSLFKSYANVINNFINIPKSLAMRHQLNMCYHMLSGKDFLAGSTEIGAGTVVEIDTYHSKMALLEKWPHYTKDSVNSVRSVTVNGVKTIQDVSYPTNVLVCYPSLVN
jgi:hypothetical protein